MAIEDDSREETGGEAEDVLLGTSLKNSKDVDPTLEFG
jgi:hypothetical protein